VRLTQGHARLMFRELAGVSRRMTDQIVEMKGSLWMSELVETMAMMM
jgi:hypothetical protein